LQVCGLIIFLLSFNNAGNSIGYDNAEGYESDYFDGFGLAVDRNHSEPTGPFPPQYFGCMILFF
jgi:hypothetical protein